MAHPAFNFHSLGPLAAACLIPLSSDAAEHWAYQPLDQGPPPATHHHPVDAFLAAEHSTRGLTPAPHAEAGVLFRRASLDLTGLPPSVAQLTEFQPRSERDPDLAFETALEELLASRHYGERWGQHWLDLVRYADTAGDASDFPVPEAWKYRNYVIDAFNKDKPYDQFIREQIAGDLLEAENDERRWEQTVATGYVAISRRIGVSPHSQRHIMIEDTLDNLGKTFLGLTLGCARCHDHKFDAITMKDYYALYGFFDSSVYPHPGAEHKPYREGFVYRIGPNKADDILREHRAELAAWDRKERAHFALYKSFQTKNITDPELTRAGVWAELEHIRSERAKFIATSFPELEIAYALSDRDGHDAHVHNQGEPRSRGALVKRRFLSLLGGHPLPPEVPGSGREYLAQWIANPENPLTARVMVNRIWHHHFGQGLVKSVSDFGVQGTAPTHPGLLDYLARRFIECGWSVKAMHRLIMTSEAYRRSSADLAANSAIDPNNSFLWRFNRRRLDAEQLRDSILSFSGQLDLNPGRRHPFPHHLTYFYRQHEPFQEVYPSNRRSVYLMQQRIQKNPYLDLFDGPDGNTPVEDRHEGTTELQALYFMNSEFAHQQADAIVERLFARSSALAARLEWAYLTIFGRSPTPNEMQAAATFLESVRDLGQSPPRAWSGLVRGMISSNEFLFVD